MKKKTENKILYILILFFVIIGGGLYYKYEVYPYDWDAAEKSFELYTKAQAIIRAISACSVKGKILNSAQLVELLYMAYNREDAEIYNLNRAMRAQYDSLYSTAPDVFAKKIKVLDEEINKKAIDVANETITKVIKELQEGGEENEKQVKKTTRGRKKQSIN